MKPSSLSLSSLITANSPASEAQPSPSYSSAQQHSHSRRVSPHHPARSPRPAHPPLHSPLPPHRTRAAWCGAPRRADGGGALVAAPRPAHAWSPCRSGTPRPSRAGAPAWRGSAARRGARGARVDEGGLVGGQKLSIRGRCGWIEKQLLHNYALPLHIWIHAFFMRFWRCHAFKDWGERS